MGRWEGVTGLRGERSCTKWLMTASAPARDQPLTPSILLWQGYQCHQGRRLHASASALFISTSARNKLSGLSIVPQLEPEAGVLHDWCISYNIISQMSQCSSCCISCLKLSQQQVWFNSLVELNLPGFDGLGAAPMLQTGRDRSLQHRKH